MIKIFRGVLQAVVDTGTGLRKAQAIGRGIRAMEEVDMLQQPGFVSSPLSVDSMLFIQVDDLVMAVAGESASRPKAATGEAVMFAPGNKDVLLRMMPDGSVRIQATSVILGTDSDAVPTAGVLTGECLDPVTGVPFPDKSSAIFASKVSA